MKSDLRPVIYELMNQSEEEQREFLLGSTYQNSQQIKELLFQTLAVAKDYKELSQHNQEELNTNKANVKQKFEKIYRILES